MKKLFSLICICTLFSLVAKSQENNYMFKGYFFNSEYNVYLKIDLHGEGIIVPDHELFGQLPGYLGKKNNSFFWLITSKTVKNKKNATIELINDYGSEDLSASLFLKNDSTLVLKQLKGSDLKVPNKGKWQKLPSELVFKRK